MSCQKCGKDCQGRWCQQCEVEETAPDWTADDTDHDECPRCGGGTHTEGEICHRCERAKEIAPDLSDDYYNDNAEVSQ